MWKKNSEIFRHIWKRIKSDENGWLKLDENLRERTKMYKIRWKCIKMDENIYKNVCIGLSPTNLSLCVRMRERSIVVVCVILCVFPIHLVLNEGDDCIRSRYCYLISINQWCLCWYGLELFVVCVRDFVFCRYIYDLSKAKITYNASIACRRFVFIWYC